MRRLALLLPLVLALPLRAGAPDQTADTCAACHEEQAAGFAKGPHGLAMKKAGPDVFARSCVTCHGDAKAHIEDPQKTNISRVPAAGACLSCHAASGTTPLTHPAHARGQVGCLACHASGHAAPAAAPLLLSRSHDLCGSCHAEQKAAAKLPSAHRDGSRPFDCRHCHTVHGKGRTGRLLQAGNGGACLDCHTDKAGPFVFAHAPREAGGCLSCHEAHGSTNPRLLTRRSVSSLCLECHASLPSSHDPTKPRYRNCLTCHVAVHGSNHDAKLLDE